MRPRVAKIFQKIDMFGASVSVLYQNKSTFKTSLGAFVSLLVYLLVLSNLASLTIAFFKGTKQTESQASAAFDVFNAGPFDLHKNHVDVSVVLHEVLPSSIGRIVAKRIFYTWENNVSVRKSIDIPFKPCIASEQQKIVAYWTKHEMSAI